jgi:PIN domain nuclease of toxin-antitoxin system
MSQYLLDTHTFIWLSENSDELLGLTQQEKDRYVSLNPSNFQKDACFSSDRY